MEDLITEQVDMSMVGQVNYSWDFDEDEYNDWLQEDMEGEQPSNENLRQYIEDNVTFDIEYLDNETFHYFDGDNLMFYQLEQDFGEKMAKQMLRNCLKSGSGSFETYELYEDEKVDLNDPESVNSAAVKLLQHGDYYKDCRGFILTNGEVVYTPQEHNQCTIIDGVKGTFDFIRLGNIRVLQQSIDLSKMPTREQLNVLRKVIASYSDDVLYLDILTNGEEIGATYVRPTVSRVLGEITRYFTDGIKPQGNKAYEEFAFLADKKQLLESTNDEFQVTCCWGCPDEVFYENNQKYGETMLRYEECGYVFGIWDGTLVCGNDNEDTSTLMHDDLIMYHVIYHGWEDIMPVKEVSDGGYDWDSLCETQVDYYDDDEYPSYHDPETGEVLDEYKQTYGDLLRALGEPFARGRILHDFSKNIDFISFWDEPTEEEVQLIIKAYGSMAKNAYWVNFSRKEDAQDFYKKYKLFTTLDWLNNNIEIPKIEKDEELYNIHNLPAKEKRETKQIKGWIDNHNQVMHNKLAMHDRNGNYVGDMPLAQYHSLIYQENREPINIIISEEQHNRLFKSTNKTIMVNHSHLKEGACKHF